MNKKRAVVVVLTAFVSFATAACSSDGEVPEDVVGRVDGTWKTDAIAIDLHTGGRSADCKDGSTICDWADAAALQVTIRSDACGDSRLEGGVRWSDAQTRVSLVIGADVFAGDIVDGALVITPEQRALGIHGDFGTCLRAVVRDALVLHR